MAAKKQHGGGEGRKVIAENRKARHDYTIVDTVEAGLVLQGTEVKSLRQGSATIADAYVRIDDDEAWIVGMHVPPYEQGNINNHEPDRSRKLLMHRREIERLDEHVTRKGHTLVPLTLYFSRGRAKLAVGIAKGRDVRDKRDAVKRREAKRDIDRELKAAGR